MMLPETYANTASVTPTMADVPVANPSSPSVRFAPLETANYKNYDWNKDEPAPVFSLVAHKE